MEYIGPVTVTLAPDEEKSVEIEARSDLIGTDATLTYAIIFSQLNVSLDGSTLTILPESSVGMYFVLVS